MTTQTQVSVAWMKTLSLDRHVLRSSNDAFPPSILHTEKISQYYDDNETINYNSSFLYSVHLKGRDFLNFCEPKSEDEELECESNTSKEMVEQKKTPSRKISFKCKKPSTYRGKAATTTLNPNTVAQLTLKFNEMVAEKHSILEQPKIARLVRRVNSQKCTQEDGAARKVVARKPSVKIKPKIEEKSVEKSKNKRSGSAKGAAKDDKICVRDKISYLETPQIAQRSETIDKSEKAPSTTSRTPVNTGSVRATIEIFERKSSLSSPDIETKNFLKDVPKPKVPEKNPNIKTKDLVIKDGVKKLKILEKRDSVDQNDATVTKSVSDQGRNNEIQTDETIKTDIEEEEEVQILNIPLVMPRRCDSMYETLNLRKISPPAHPLKTAKSEGTVPGSPSPEPAVKPNASFLWRRKSQEASVNPTSQPEEDWESLYDAVEVAPKSQDPPAVPPRPTSLNLPNATAKPQTPPKMIFKKKMPLPEEETEEKIYEELGYTHPVSHSYEYCRSPSKYEDLEEQKSDDGYEYFESTSPVKPKQTEDIYETLPAPPPAITRKQEEPLPPRPASRDSYDTVQNGEGVSNCYESIYNAEERGSNLNSETISNNYESIYGCQLRIENWESASNRDSLVSSDQQSNSLYGRSLSGWPNDDVNVYNGKAPSDLSGSDKSDEWIDISDNEESSKTASGFVIVRERQRNKKTSGWSQKIRDQWNKSHSLEQGDGDFDHHYESLYNARDNYQDNDDFDSFDSDTESESSYSKTNQNDSGVDMGNSQLPDPPSSQLYGFTKLAVSAGKHMKRLRRNWSLTKNDITKSLSRMAKRKSRADLDSIDPTKITATTTAAAVAAPTTTTKDRISSPLLIDQNNPLSNVTQELKMRHADSQANLAPYQNVQISNKENSDVLDQSEKNNRSNSLSKKKFLNKFRRSMSISNEAASEVTQNIGNKPKSTFYLTDTIDVDDDKEQQTTKSEEVNLSISPKTIRNYRVSQRPSSPPPPIPVDTNQNIDSSKALKNSKRSTSWYAECGLFRNTENLATHNTNKRPNTSWYAEIGLYQTSTSTPSTSSAENSGSTTVNSKSPEPDSLNSIKDSEEYFNLKNENSSYYNQSINSFNSDGKVEKCPSISADIQLRLQDEPLYQFYDAAVLESVCQDGTSDFDYDGYEEVGDKANSDYSESRLSTRPSAMQLISPNRNGSSIGRTLWCEIPEVLQSAVLSTLSIHQKKLQEAKFEMMTSEASYLNSLNVLTDHFISNLSNSDLLTYEEKNILFGKIPAVKRCSEKLLSDLEKCWQENILLHSICDIIQGHAEENFHVYISYCENQILLDSTLRKIRDRSNSNDLLKQLECSTACQSLSLYSFLMLPMQRVTRWPLLVDAVLKRLSPQDEGEYLPCQYTLATINKIVTQCNEAARKMERETEIKRIATLIEFPRGMPLIKLVSGSRWLIRSGPLTQMQARADDIKLTFGKRFTKVPLNLFLFNDLLLVTKPRSDDCFVVLHYCYRSYIELNVNDTIGSLPTRDMQGRHLLFLTMLENHEGKTVEMLLSCSSESDKERWIEALTPPISEDPDETLYECWDCPQVTAVHNYGASQPDELALSRGDIVNVTRKMADGWYHGERIRDGLTGWFPANYTVEVANPHVRARNLKQRYRLLAFSENYLKSK